MHLGDGTFAVLPVTLGGPPLVLGRALFPAACSPKAVSSRHAEVTLSREEGAVLRHHGTNMTFVYAGGRAAATELRGDDDFWRLSDGDTFTLSKAASPGWPLFTWRRVVLPPHAPTHWEKDQAKADRANKFIGRGAADSSTHKYMRAWAALKLANCGAYCSSDCVFVSVNGDRKERKLLDEAELGKATAAGATIITDALAERNTAYNVGEQSAAAFLQQAGYRELNDSGVWKRA
jgi:hypothetical protein